MPTSEPALFREFFDQVIALHHVTESKRHSPETRFMELLGADDDFFLFDGMPHDATDRANAVLERQDRNIAKLGVANCRLYALVGQATGDNQSIATK